LLLLLLLRGVAEVTQGHQEYMQMNASLPKAAAGAALAALPVAAPPAHGADLLAGLLLLQWQQLPGYLPHPHQQHTDMGCMSQTVLAGQRQKEGMTSRHRVRNGP